MSKRALTVVLAIELISATLLAVGPIAPVDAQASPGPILGAYAQPIDGLNNREALAKLEGQLGTTLPMVRAFSDWDDRVGPQKPLHVWTRDGGRDLFLSVKPKRGDGSIVTWNEIVTAQPGSRIYGEMQTLARGIKAYQAPMIFGFHHEPEQGTNQQFGTSADFRAAYAKVHQVFTAEGVTNVEWAWIMTEWSFEVETIRPNDRRVADKWYPGDDIVDIIASDTYNWNNCRGNTTDPWRTLEDDLAPVMRFSAKHPGKKLVLAEFGSDEGSPGQKAAWIAEAQALFKQAPYRDAFAALLYFHDDGREEGVPECDWWLDSSTSSLDAAADWFNDPFYRSDLATPNANRCDGKAATLVGTSGNDRLSGTPEPDVIMGLGGNDIIAGLAGDDTICGGHGDDEIRGGGGSDRLFGEGGSDFVLGGYGPDYIVGGLGPDRLNGQHGNDEVFGSEGKDVIRGGPHQDILRGGTHPDRILGQGGWDTIFGGHGDDVLSGGVGADTITGGLGNDRCTGDDGRDQVSCETSRP